MSPWPWARDMHITHGMPSQPWEHFLLVTSNCTSNDKVTIQSVLCQNLTSKCHLQLSARDTGISHSISSLHTMNVCGKVFKNLHHEWLNPFPTSSVALWLTCTYINQTANVTALRLYTGHIVSTWRILMVSFKNLHHKGWH